jgi:ribokinase
MPSKILNFGSLNIDHVYSVPHFVRPGETLASLAFRSFAGGKGNNQSIALARAGARVFHAGAIGADGIFLKEKLKEAGADTSFVSVLPAPTGHAIIQVNPQGQNSIILQGGANQLVSKKQIDRVLAHFSRGDFLLLQNEISEIPYLLKRGARQGLKIVFNPSPMDASVLKYPLQCVDIFILNEIEAGELSRRNSIGKIISALKKKYPRADIVLTLGSKGVCFASADQMLKIPAVKVKAVDTTAAGDTFTGYFLAELARGEKPGPALSLACRAAALCVMRPGAADSIPTRDQVYKQTGNPKF